MKANKPLLLILVFAAISVLGFIAGYLYMPEVQSPAGRITNLPDEDKRLYMKIYYPTSEGLEMEERMVGLGQPPEEAALREFLESAPSSGKGSYTPRGAMLLGVYRGKDGILYVDLSNDFRGKADATAEFLLLRALYETVMANTEGIKDIKVLIEGKEVETLGGHLPLLYPLGRVVAGPGGK